MAKKIELLFSDVEFGTREYGFIPRIRNSETVTGFENEDEDLKYRRFLKEKGVQARVVEGTVYLEES